jgi:hypothetical protein
MLHYPEPREKFIQTLLKKIALFPVNKVEEILDQKAELIQAVYEEDWYYKRLGVDLIKEKEKAITVYTRWIRELEDLIEQDFEDWLIRD